MRPDQLKYLLGYNIWADKTVLAAARHLTNEQLRVDQQMGFGSAFETLVHIMGAQQLWLMRWKGQSPAGLPLASQFDDLDQLSAAWDDVHAAY
jgi:uncharacterized damage-inducible protein DinB